ncbi:TrbC/VirB2 family protein [Francisella philomiragia]|uniref:TrbC/VirB2 family protein n=1 Tax=Francisella philomiragia TaxID=28110 RepID=UPI0019067070|nr:TrbC/VirB2 family protein [Francisella philomiragia]MBK2270166.1 TrbC/VirB2 family protein [Francisella philomiragia]MBK2275830.1 TrbC/VirB2 family protein [Francisella philomiragia]MBK2305101.1 TrbC/VirB2 family protein [Francisella philomiragia]
MKFLTIKRKFKVTGRGITKMLSIPSLFLLATSASYANASDDPLSKGLGDLADFLANRWGVAALFVIFIFSVAAVAFSEDKAKTMKVAGIVCVVGVVVVGAAKIWELFGLSGAVM